MTDPLQCTAVGIGLSLQVMHRAAKFTIYSHDRRGTRMTEGGDPYSVTIRGPSRVHPVLHDNRDGSYECEWQGTVSGVRNRAGRTCHPLPRRLARLPRAYLPAWPACVPLPTCWLQSLLACVLC